MEPNSFHVCITSYKQFFRGHAAFTRVRWKCLVIDEMQRVKSMTEKHWGAVFALHRLVPCPPGSVLLLSHNILLKAFRGLHTQRMAFLLASLCLSQHGGWQRREALGSQTWPLVLCSQQRLLLIDAPLHNTFLELWTMAHFLIPGLSRPYLHLPLKAPSEESQDYYHKVVIRLHRVRAVQWACLGTRAW